MWALGEYDRIADGLTISTDQTLRVARIRPGEHVLDVALGRRSTTRPWFVRRVTGTTR